MVAAGLLVAALPVTDELGLGLVVVFLLIHWRRSRTARVAPAGDPGTA
jgi:hypothetical protein